jgi:hypothetical protein
MLSAMPLLTAVTPNPCRKPFGDACGPSGMPAGTSFVLARVQNRIGGNGLHPLLNRLLPSLKDTENIVRAEKDFFFHVVGTFSVNSSVSLFLPIIQQRGLSYMVF